MKAYVLALIVSLFSFIVNGDTTDVEQQLQTKSTLAPTTSTNDVSKTKIYFYARLSCKLALN